MTEVGLNLVFVQITFIYFIQTTNISVSLRLECLPVKLRFWHVFKAVVPRMTKLHGYHRQLHIEATLRSDGTFVCGEIVSASPSVAAGQAITAKSGQKSPGRNYLSINGWLFWQVTCRDGKARTLADLRRELFEARQRASGKV